MEALGLESRAKPLLPKTEKAVKPPRRSARTTKKDKEKKENQDTPDQEAAPKAKAKAKAGAGVRKTAPKKKGE